MSRKSVKVAVTYIVTILITLVVAGGVVWYMLTHMLFQEKEDPTSSIHLEEMVDSENYEPALEDNRTLLLIIDTEKRQTASCFVVTSFLATEQQLVLLPLPSNTFCESDSGSDTLYNIYRNGGTTAAVKAVESCIDVKIDKYMKFNEESFYVIADLFGGVDYDVPYNLVYTNPDTGEETIIREGKTYINSSDIRKIITYPNFNSGEEYRAKAAGVIFSSLINSALDASYATHLDEYFSTVINSDVETDITAYDYEESAEAVKYVIQNNQKPAVFVPASGTTDESGAYHLDENFLKSITEWFKLYDKDGNPTRLE